MTGNIIGNVNTDLDDWDHDYYFLEVDDFTGDPIPEVIIGGKYDDREEGGILIFDANLTEVVFNKTMNEYPSSVRLADFNNDSNKDVAIGTVNSNILIYDGNSQSLLLNYTTPAGVFDVLEVGDFNNDSIPDVVAPSTNGTIYVLNGTTGETLFTHQHTK